MKTVAALYVDPRGPYAGQPGVDLWDEARDARNYIGPHPVVAHPPCGRWSKLAPLVEARYGYQAGDDGGCFAAALVALVRFGGVLEHPADSKAWAAFHINAPPAGGGWTWANWGTPGMWTCEVAQRNYGHRARKRTWLLTSKIPLKKLPRFVWGDGETPELVIGTGADWIGKMWAAGRKVEHMTKRERQLTPVQFRDLLLSMARSVTRFEEGRSRTAATTRSSRSTR